MTRISLLIVSLVLLTACSGKEPVSREDQQAEAFADLRAAVEMTVEDDERAGQVLVLVDDFEQDVNALRELLVKRRAELRRLNADYDTTREQMSQFAREMEEDIKENRASLLKAFNEMVAATTGDEWADLGRDQEKAMKSISQSLQGI